MRVAIVGSRDFKDYDYLSSCMDYLNTNGNVTEVVCGCARGADTLGEKWANERGIAVKRCPADWDGLGKKAGILRNIEMADYADATVAFWDGKSRGTKQMIEYSRKIGNDVRVKMGEKPWL